MYLSASAGKCFSLSNLISCMQGGLQHRFAAAQFPQLAKDVHCLQLKDPSYWCLAAIGFSFLPARGGGRAVNFGPHASKTFNDL